MKYKLILNKPEIEQLLEYILYVDNCKYNNNKVYFKKRHDSIKTKMFNIINKLPKNKKRTWVSGEMMQTLDLIHDKIKHDFYNGVKFRTRSKHHDIIVSDIAKELGIKDYTVFGWINHNNVPKKYQDKLEYLYRQILETSMLIEKGTI